MTTVTTKHGAHHAQGPTWAEVAADPSTLGLAHQPGQGKKDFNPDQERDDHGRWTSGGSGGGVQSGDGARSFDTKKEALAALSPVYRQWYDTAGGEAMRAWETVFNFRAAQAVLRGTTEELKAGYAASADRILADYVEPEGQRTADLLTEAIDLAPPLPFAMEAYRGVESSVVAGLKVGDVYTDKGFTATGTSPNAAGAFEPDGPQTSVAIELPEGTKAGWAPWGELVLPAGSSFRVTEASDRALKMELVP